MNFNAETPRNEITIQGTVYTVPAPFVEAHPITAGEASALNQLLAENVRNNVAGKIKAEVAKAEEEKRDPVPFTQEEVDEYVADYEFGVRRAGGSREASLPPEEREARRIAREMIGAKLKEKGLTIKSVAPEKMEELVAQLATREDVKKEADRRVKQVGKISLEGLELAA